MSPPTLWDGKDDGTPFTKVYPVDLAVNSGAAVDVGFRLAFTAPTEPPALRLQRLLAGRAYLTATGE